jgi:DNA-binding MarR family transcriptional regulator
LRVPRHAVVVSLTSEADNAELLTAANQLRTPVILIWETSTTHISRRNVRAMVTALFVTNAALDRARRQKKGASTPSLVEVTTDTADRRSCRVTLTSAGSDELQSLTEEGLDRFGLFVADWEPEEVRMLTSLLQKLEASKAAAAARQRPLPGRHWARQTA